MRNIKIDGSVRIVNSRRPSIDRKTKSERSSGNEVPDLFLNRTLGRAIVYEKHRAEFFLPQMNLDRPVLWVKFCNLILAEFHPNPCTNIVDGVFWYLQYRVEVSQNGILTSYVPPAVSWKWYPFLSLISQDCGKVHRLKTNIISAMYEVLPTWPN